MVMEAEPGAGVEEGACTADAVCAKTGRTHPDWAQKVTTAMIIVFKHAVLCTWTATRTLKPSSLFP
jgi:hypothetical protein